MTEDKKDTKDKLLDVNIRDLVDSFFDTVEMLDIKVFSDSFCCQLLAWLYVFGDDEEKVVSNHYLRESLFYAQRRLNLLGGEIPNAELMLICQSYVKEAQEARDGKIDMPDWVISIEKRYRLT
jgi:hypothetical protein